MMFDMDCVGALESARLLNWFDAWTTQWHQEPGHAATSASIEAALEAAIENLHWANFELWHQEDVARDAEAGDAVIAAAKRTIDHINQRRNDQVEQCDALLLEMLAKENLPAAEAEPHSETPGMMLDRLSILSLKRYHTLEELERPGAPAGHRERNRQRLRILETQRNDLATCLDRFWRRVLQRESCFKIYRQLKMYNDPELNPALYKRSGH